MITKNDSIDKIVSGYFAALTRESFTYKNVTYNPKPMLVSPLLFRGYTCPSSCGACCHRVTLDFLPSESQPDGLQPRIITFNNHAYYVMSDLQDDRTHPKCRHLDLASGRCNIHTHHPMPCDVELMKFIHYEEKSLLAQKLYGRGWALTRIDGERGALCEMLPPDDFSVKEVVRKLYRLKDWTTYFELNTWIDSLIAWAESYSPAHQAIRLTP